MHEPITQESVCVHALPSLQDEPLGLAGLEHIPVAASHVPASWHWSMGIHVMAMPAVHVPATQRSACVQLLPSLHVVPSGLAGLEHIPVAGLHIPASRH